MNLRHRAERLGAAIGNRLAHAFDPSIVANITTDAHRFAVLDFGRRLLTDDERAPWCCLACNARHTRNLTTHVEHAPARIDVRLACCPSDVCAGMVDGFARTLAPGGGGSAQETRPS